MLFHFMSEVRYKTVCTLCSPYHPRANLNMWEVCPNIFQREHIITSHIILRLLVSAVRALTSFLSLKDFSFQQIQLYIVLQVVNSPVQILLVFFLQVGW